MADTETEPVRMDEGVMLIILNKGFNKRFRIGIKRNQETTWFRADQALSQVEKWDGKEWQRITATRVEDSRGITLTWSKDDA